MNKGIEILLERMKSNPEEFVEQEGYGSKWSGIVAMYKDALDPEDYEAFASARRKLIQDQFTAEVMKELLDPKSETNPYIVKSAMHSGGQTLGRSSVSINNTNAVTGTIGTVTLPNGSLTLGQTQLKEEQVKHMIAHLDWLKREEQLKQKEKKSKTLFGKLFNYQ